MGLIAYFEHLHSRTDPRILALFRILFGLLMCYEMSYYLDIDLVEMGITGPKVLFKYEGFSWVEPLGTGAMNAILGGLLVASLFIAAGLLYRAAIVYFLLGYTYIFLLDKGYYNNHFYLFVLLSFLLSFVPANRTWSLDRLLLKRWVPDRGVPYWTWIMFRLQVCIVYFYGGIAKLNGDWLVHQQPMRLALEAFAEGSALEGLLTSTPVVAFFTYGGLLFDLTIGPLLWLKRTRKYALPFVLLFNITNHWIFDDIGVFPFFMIAATLVFFDPEEFAGLFGRGQAKRKREQREEAPKGPGTDRRLVHTGLALYFTFQLLFPLRWLLLPGDPDWTTIAQRFSWRMKVSARDPVRINFYVRVPGSQATEPVTMGALINNHQQQLLAYDPRATVQFAKWIQQDYARQGRPGLEVLSAIIISYNGRPYRWWFNPGTDLASVEPDIRDPAAWVPPFEPGPEHTLSERMLLEIEKRKKKAGKRKG